MHRVIRNVPAISYTAWSLVFPGHVSGQVAVTPASPTPMGGVVALGIIVALLVLVGIGVKLYDVKAMPSARIVRLMREKAFRRLPVEEDGRVIGMLTIGDIAAERDVGSVLADISTAPPNT